MKYRTRTFYSETQKALMWERWRSRHQISWLSYRITSSGRDRRTEMIRMLSLRYVMTAGQCFASTRPITRNRGSERDPQWRLPLR